MGQAAEKINYVWRAQERQNEALLSPAFEQLFGGARGGGKTDLLLMDYAKDVNTYGRHWKGILFRQSYPELEDLVDRAIELYPAVFPGSYYAHTRRTFCFPSGARLRIRHGENQKDIAKYQGHAYPWVGADELTTWKDPMVYLKMIGFCRSAHGVPTRMRATANPGGPGHAWVKQRFIDLGLPWALHKIIPDPENPQDFFYRQFIPSRLEDNPALQNGDPMYGVRLSMLPEHLKKMWRWGNWDVMAGQVFDNFSRRRHVIRPFTIPKAWKKFRCFDWGSTKPFSCLWLAVDVEGRLFVYRELYGNTGDPENPDQGIKWSSQQVAKAIKAAEKGQHDEGLCRGNIADPSIFNKIDGPSIAEKMAGEGVHWLPADNDRMNGLQELYNRLDWTMDGEQRPGIMFFATVVHTIRTLPLQIYDENKPEDLDTDGEDHCYDALRYGCMSRPWRTFTGPEQKRLRAQNKFKPLDRIAGY